jgi:hypothetical protein
VSDLGVKVSGCGEGDRGSGKGGPKRLRKVLRSNTRGSMKLAIRHLAAKKRLKKQTEMQIGLWPRVSSPGWRQETGPRRMGGGPMERDSPPDKFSGHRRPPKRLLREERRLWRESR